MLKAMMNMPNMKEEINKSVEAEMFSRYGDMLNDGSLEREALEDIHNEDKAGQIAFELGVIDRKTGNATLNKKHFEIKAREILGDKKLGEAIKASPFYLAEVKASREAGKALGKKDYEKAAEWKSKQLLNHYLYKESLILKKDIEKSIRFYAKIKKVPTVGKVRIDEDYRIRALNLLQDFNLAPRNADYVKTNIIQLEDWKKEQVENGALGLVGFPEIAEFQDKDNIRSLTTEEFRTLDDAIRNLENVGRASRSIVIDGKRVEIRKIGEDIKETIENNLKKKVEFRGNLTTKQKAAKLADSFFAPLSKAKDIALKLDGEKPLGTFYNYFIKPVADGEIVRSKMMEEAYKKLDAIQRKHFGDRALGIEAGKISGKKIYIPEVDFSYSKQDMIAFALNWGNETNRKRIRDGFNYTDAQVNTILSKLTKMIGVLLSDMWKVVASYFPEVSDFAKEISRICS
jgi:hypothetical protein